MNPEHNTELVFARDLREGDHLLDPEGLELIIVSKEDIIGPRRTEPYRIDFGVKYAEEGFFGKEIRHVLKSPRTRVYRLIPSPLKKGDKGGCQEPGPIDQRTARELLAALNQLQNSFIHIEGDTAGNKARTNIIAKCDNVKTALNNARAAIHKAEPTGTPEPETHAAAETKILQDFAGSIRRLMAQFGAEHLAHGTPEFNKNFLEDIRPALQIVKNRIGGYPAAQVVIGVSGGVAEVQECSPGIDVIIHDYDEGNE